MKFIRIHGELGGIRDCTQLHKGFMSWTEQEEGASQFVHVQEDGLEKSLDKKLMLRDNNPDCLKIG